MKQLVFATANPNKIREIKHLMGDSYNFLSLTDIGCHEDIPETRPTIEGNALQKAEYVLNNYQKDCFSEDTGLLIDALDGRPGVYSARYAGDHKSSEDNIDKVLEELDNQQNRTARFKTVIALILDGKSYTFEGIVEGEILSTRQGSGGFGYDPIFLPKGYKKSFAEMTADEKSEISHRARAMRKLHDFLQNLA